MKDKMGETLHNYWTVASNGITGRRQPFFSSYIFIGKRRGGGVVYIYKIDQSLPDKMSSLDYEQWWPHSKASDVTEKMINVE